MTQNSFKNNIPDEKWFNLFLRHPDIGKRHAESINLRRACVTEESIRQLDNELTCMKFKKARKKKSDCFIDPKCKRKDLAPMIIYPYERIPAEIVCSLNSEWVAERSKSQSNILWLCVEYFSSLTRKKEKNLFCNLLMVTDHT
ncbi:hypothetical protein PR048_012413 [Dryococelus australis]|uniref:Uncharacterized protein n=1 Tax=Dryococelus australis TaxID=614101 RepID=A0ABQ9HPD3_9NEOP|nr:hypothetical protein PR048_012413 [Dryococelus australis]